MMTRHDEQLVLECMTALNAVMEKLNPLVAKYRHVSPPPADAGGSKGQPVAGGGSRKGCDSRGDSKEPYYRSQKGAWYVWVGGKQKSLGVKGEANRTKAAMAFAKMLSPPVPVVAPVPPATQPHTGPTVAELCAAFRADCEARTKLPDGAQRMEPHTVKVWTHMMQRFTTKYGSDSAQTLDRDAVVRWACGYGKSNASVNLLLAVIVACMKWAHRTKRIRENPLSGLQKLPQPSRGAKVALTAEQFAKLRETATYDAFRNLLDAMWHTGCRPGEIAVLTAADVDLVAGVATLARHKARKKTNEPRLVFLSSDALTLFTAQMAKHPTGPLFRNYWSRAWQAATWGWAMRKARKAAGIPQAICYGLRHSYATAALVKGVPDATVAALLGHSGTAMLHKHYSHLTSRAQVMRAAAAQVRT